MPIDPERRVEQRFDISRGHGGKGAQVGQYGSNRNGMRACTAATDKHKGQDSPVPASAAGTFCYRADIPI